MNCQTRAGGAQDELWAAHSDPRTDFGVSMKQKVFIALLPCLVLLAAPKEVARADVVSLAPARDNTLYEDANGSISNGAGQHLFAGTTAEGDVRRALLFFDMTSAVPNGAIIDSVTLRLNVSRTISGPAGVQVHRVTADWGAAGSNAPDAEGSGAPAAIGDATWVHRFFNTSSWTVPGGDFSAMASATTSVGSPGSYLWSSDQMRLDAQDWLDNPAFNFGWLLRTNELTSPSAKRFDSVNHPNATVRPELIVSFTVPEPAVGIILAIGAIVSWRRRTLH